MDNMPEKVSAHRLHDETSGLCCHGHEHHEHHEHGHEHGNAASLELAGGGGAVSLSCCGGHDGAQHAHAHGDGGSGTRWWPLAIAMITAVAAEAVGWAGGPGWLSLALALAAIALSGVGVYRQGIASLLKGDLNINALMGIAVTGAVLLGHWPEAAMVMVLFTIAEAIEEKSLDRARDAIGKLMEVAPERVTVRGDDGAWTQVPAANVAPGAVLRVRPGERIGLDGIVTAGVSAVDQAPITGESIPVGKQSGDSVYAGTINGMGELEYRATSGFQDTTLARIIVAVQQAQARKAPIQRFVDQFARIYTPIVADLALAIAVLPPLLLSGASWGEWAYKALVLLVIACPCALVISTPVAVVSGLAAAARHGILVKGGVYLERGRKLRWLLLDKTGTLTTGSPGLMETVSLAPDLDAGHCRALAASLGVRSDHPVSRAIAHGVEAVVLDVANFQAEQGAGVHGTISGETYFLGSPQWLDAQLDSAARQIIADQQAQGRTVSVLATSSRALAVFGVADRLKPASQQAVQDLHALGLRTAMVSGDNAVVAQSIGAQVGVGETHAGLLPDDKLALLERYAGEGDIGMVGDGINDAPALARADIGFAMGAMGTDTAIETADVALMDDDLRKIPRFIRLSRATHAVLVQNICAALGIKLAFLALTIAGLGTMWMAVFADVGASLLVVANSLRLLRK
jgi:Cd2+/Zn2+-exporting ATPase